MKVTPELVKKVAEVTRIELTDEQIEKLIPKLESVITEIKKLDEVDTEGVEPIIQVTGLKDVMDKDEIRQFKDTQSLLKCSKLKDGSFIRVKKAV